MANLDLRNWLGEMERNSELRCVSGARREDEIGGIVDIYQRKMGNPTLLFDDIPGFAKGYRVMANILTSRRRTALTLGLPGNASDLDLVRFWRKYMSETKLIPPQVVDSGPVLENVQSGQDVNLTQFPTPTWHEYDGGPYIGTGCMVIMKDPDSDWVNVGTYRLQAYEDGHIAALMVSKGKHGDIISRRYYDRGQPCPVAVVVGMHPVFLIVGGVEVAYGVSEYDAIGGFLNNPVRTIKGPKTGLPIPADAEIAFEGTITPGDLIKEGPFGEWTGYYAGGVRNLPVIRIDTLMYRNDPIITGAVPAVPPCDDTYYRGHFRCAEVWNQIEAAGVRGIKGVWAHESGGSRFWLTIAIQQMYPGHAKQVGLIASQCQAGAYANHWVVVVDDDIDPANMNEVIWAMSTRVDPREDLEVIKNCWSTALDPMSYPEGNRVLNSRVVVDACRPWIKRDSFPRVARSSKEMDAKIRARWGHVLPDGA